MSDSRRLTHARQTLLPLYHVASALLRGNDLHITHSKREMSARSAQNRTMASQLRQDPYIDKMVIL